MPCTKIVATIGPASNTPEMIDALFAGGVDVFRINMSHGDHETHARVIGLIRDTAARAGRPAGIMCDLSGPKIRIGAVAGGPVQVNAGDLITITTDPVPEGGATLVSCNYKDLPTDVQTGQRILLDDGLLEFEVVAVRAPEVKCRVVRGGPLGSNKGLNLPNTRLRISALTEKDRADIEFGLTHDVDMFALSFVKRVQDIEECRYFIKFKGGNLPIIAKIEKGEAVENIEAILEEADGAMVARGDLGVEIPLEEVPHVQKRVIALCNRLGKPVITATQMLDSMIRAARPTRAEVTDVANAILDGTDAVMMSAETAAGAYPLEAVAVMKRVADATEKHLDYEALLAKRPPRPTGPVIPADVDPTASLVLKPGNQASVSGAIAHATARIAHDIDARHILCLTQGGSTPRRVARHRPKCGILAYCAGAREAQQLCLTWGVRAVPRTSEVDVVGERREGMEAHMRKAVQVFLDRGDVRPGDRVVITAGLPLHEPGTTNLVRVIEVE